MSTDNNLSEKKFFTAQKKSIQKLNIQPRRFLIKLFKLCLTTNYHVINSPHRLQSMNYATYLSLLKSHLNRSNFNSCLYIHTQTNIATHTETLRGSLKTF